MTRREFCGLVLDLYVTGMTDDQARNAVQEYSWQLSEIYRAECVGPSWVITEQEVRAMYDEDMPEELRTKYPRLAALLDSWYETPNC